MNDILPKLVEFVKRSGVKRSVAPENIATCPLRDLIDSIGMIDFLLHIENGFEIEIDDEEVGPDTFGSLKSVEAFVRGKLAGSEVPCD